MHAQRRSLLMLLLLAGPVVGMAADETAPTLRAGESIELPGLSLKVLGVDWKRGATVTFRLRGMAPVDRQALVDNSAVRLFVAGVPRAPTAITPFVIDKESAVDFTQEFRVPERTDDLVLQVRFEGAVERRRIAAK